MGSDHPSTGVVMPFVACITEGGRYDDASFVAGFTCGQAWVELAKGRTWAGWVPVGLVKQLDLVAMYYGARFTDERNPDRPDDAYVTITRPAA